MKYKDSFWNHYIINPFLEIILDYWYCHDCKKRHSSRIVKYYYIENDHKPTCREKKNIEN